MDNIRKIWIYQYLTVTNLNSKIIKTLIENVIDIEHSV